MGFIQSQEVFQISTHNGLQDSDFFLTHYHYMLGTLVGATHASLTLIN